jgi:Putative Ig domain
VHTQRTRIVCSGLVLVLLAVGCGGGGGGNDGPPPAAPAISYGFGDGPGGTNITQFVLNTQTAVSLNPTNNGGPVASWTVTPTLPAGLVFNPSTGAITGTSANILLPTTFTVTATNAGGSSKVTLTLAAGSVLLNLGASCFVDMSGAFQQGALAISATNLLTEDCGQRQHWVLWSYSVGAVLAQGDACPVNTCNIVGGLQPNIALAGQIAVVPYTSAEVPGPVGFKVLSVADGSVVATVTPSDGVVWWRVASDGSYICGAVGNSGNLMIWAPDGTVITTRTGDYSRAAAFCAPGQVRVAAGPAGSNVVETIAVSSGVSTLSQAFAGTFYSWFLDGSAFLSTVGTTVWIYSPGVAQQDMRVLTSVSGLAGSGPWFWTWDPTPPGGANPTLNVYKVGASSTVTATYTASLNSKVVPSGSTIAILGVGLPLVRIIDLSGAVPSETDYSPPFSDVYASVSPSQWVVGSGASGALLDGASLGATPRYFGYGSLRSIAGSQTRLAVATSIGEILVFNTDDFSLETTLHLSAEELSISGDGRVLAIRQGLDPYTTDNSVSTISLPSGSVINAWSYPGNGPYPTDITVSSSGALLGQVLSTSGSPMRQVTASNGGPVLWSDTGSSLPIRLSLDDTLIAASDGTNTTIYLNDAQSSAVPGVAVGWLPNDELLADVSGGGAIFNSAGIKQNGPTLPSLTGPIQLASATSLFDAHSNAIYSLSTGASTWSGPGYPPSAGTVAGNRVAFTFHNQLVTEPY